MKKRTHICLLLALVLLVGVFGGCRAKPTEENGDAADMQTEEITEVIGDDGIKLSNDASDFVLLTEAVPQLYGEKFNNQMKEIVKVVLY